MLPWAMPDINVKPNSEMQLIRAEQLMIDFPVHRKYFDNFKWLATGDENHSMRTFFLWWREKKVTMIGIDLITLGIVGMVGKHAIHYTTTSFCTYLALIWQYSGQSLSYYFRWRAHERKNRNNKFSQTIQHSYMLRITELSR